MNQPTNVKKFVLLLFYTTSLISIVIPIATTIMLKISASDIENLGIGLGVAFVYGLIVMPCAILAILASIMIIKADNKLQSEHFWAAISYLLIVLVGLIYVLFMMY